MPECVQHQRDTLITQRRELSAKHTTSRDLVTVTEAHQSQHHLLRRDPGWLVELEVDGLGPSRESAAAPPSSW